MNKKKTQFIQKLVLFLTITMNVILASSRVFAQSDINLTVSPPIQYLNIVPGTDKIHTIILENNSDSPITVKPEIFDFTTDGRTGRVIVSDRFTFPYIALDNNKLAKLTIPPNNDAKLSLNIFVPDNAEEKEYPMTILFHTEQGNNDGKGSKINAAIGSNLIVLISRHSTFTKVFEILDFTLPKFIDSFQQIKFAPIVQNNSISATIASGSAQIVNWRKEVVTEFEVYPDSILGHNSRELRSLLSNPDTTGPEVGSFTYKPRFLLGPYKIILQLTDDDNNIILTEERDLYALPIIIIIILILGTAVFWYFTKINPKMKY